jgi:hypothetical protein
MEDLAMEKNGVLYPKKTWEEVTRSVSQKVKESAERRREEEEAKRNILLSETQLVQGLDQVDASYFAEIDTPTGPMGTSETHSTKLSRRSKPQASKDVLWVEHVPAASKKLFVIYSPSVYGFDKHFNGKYSVPCWENHDLCEDGHKLSTLRTHFYVHAWDFVKKQQCILYLTNGGCRQLLNQMAPGVSLRGQVIEVERTEKSQGRQNVKRVGLHNDIPSLPKARDPELSVLHEMGCEAVRGRVRRHLSGGEADYPLEPGK